MFPNVQLVKKGLELMTMERARTALLRQTHNNAVFAMIQVFVRSAFMAIILIDQSLQLNVNHVIQF